MSTVIVPRSGVTVEEVSAILRRTLGPRYRIMPSKMASGFGKEGPGDPSTILVASSWLDRANVSVVDAKNSTEIHVSPGATYFGLIRLFHRAGLVHKVQQALEHAPELTTSN